MSDRTMRKNAALLPWLRALAFGGVTFAALAPLSFYPKVVPPVLALAAAVCAMFAPAVSVLVFVIAVAIPLAASNILVGSLFLLLGLAMITYLGGENGKAFLVISLAYLAVTFHAEWGVIVLAGYLVGAGDGAVAAFAACLAIEMGGLLMGQPSVGVLAVGGSRPPLLDLAVLAKLGESGKALTFSWIATGIGKMRPGDLLGALTSMRYVVLFVLQPFLWAAAAALGGTLARPVGDPKRPVFGLVSAGVGVVALGVASSAVMLAMGGPVALPQMVTAIAVGLVVALAGAAAGEWVFSPSVAPSAPKRVFESAEDADVDELLRMISSAEEELTSKHTALRTVMITDMKAFSRITQERGSVLTAKLVQRHRDLCLPVITRNGGKGKSSGGDGLVAAFDDPASALRASVEMQRVLDEYNTSRPGDEEILVRIGVATGEVVLDKGGKPFLGDGLNLAARVMGLADGGQVFTTAPVVADAGQLPYGSVDHGSFKLKNISEPVELIEVLWRDGQQASAPQTPAEEKGTAAETPADAPEAEAVAPPADEGPLGQEG